MCVCVCCVRCVCVYLCTWVQMPVKVREIRLPLELEFQWLWAASCVLETEITSFGGAVCTLTAELSLMTTSGLRYACTCELTYTCIHTHTDTDTHTIPSALSVLCGTVYLPFLYFLICSKEGTKWNKENMTIGSFTSTGRQRRNSLLVLRVGFILIFVCFCFISPYVIGC